MGGRWVGRCFVLAGMVICTSPAQSLEYESFEVDGTPYLEVKGEFLPGEDISRFVRAQQKNDARIVVFNSPGGNVSAAMQIGRTIRLLGLDAFQIRQMECASACALAFVGGVIRYADPGSIGVHRSSFSSGAQLGRDEAVARVQEGTADILAYLREMGVDPSLLEFALRYDQTDMRYLSKSEMKSLGVTTFDGSGVGGSSQKQPCSIAPERLRAVDRQTP